jgi:putative flippase GtrA
MTLLIKIADAWDRRILLAKLVSFASVGVVNVAVDVSVFAVAFHLLQLQLVPSNILAWIIAVTGSYAMNSKITFGRETGGALSLARYFRFAVSGILGVASATTVLVLLSPYTAVPIAKLASITVAFGLNFCMSHLIVFRVPTADAARAPM